MIRFEASESYESLREESSRAPHSNGFGKAVFLQRGMAYWSNVTESDREEDPLASAKQEITQPPEFVSDQILDLLTNMLYPKIMAKVAL